MVHERAEHASDSSAVIEEPRSVSLGWKAVALPHPYNDGSTHRWAVRYVVDANDENFAGVTVEIADWLDEASAHLIAAAPDMFRALLDIKLIAEMQIEDICADIQEGGNTAVNKMELARWNAVLNALAKAEGK